MSRLSRNTKLFSILAAIVVLMFGAAFAAVPLYKLFCQVTGYGGTTQVVDYGLNDDIEILDRKMKITFNADIDPKLKWEFNAPKETIEINVGESALISYWAKNNTNKRITGTATYNVTPQKMGEYFVKQECFCFTQQTLNPGQEVSMPVSFYIDPAIAEDSNMDDVNTITLSYTFFESTDDEE